MNHAQVLAINHARLGRWAEKLATDHSTPVILLGVGHDHVSGRPIVLLMEDGPLSEEHAAAQWLRMVADQLEGKK